MTCNSWLRAGLVCLSLVVAAAACGSKGSDTAPTSPTTTTTPTPAATPSTTFQGTIAGRNGQTGTVNITVQATVTTTSFRPLATVSATGTVHPAGGASTSLTGTFDDVARTAALSGGGYSFSGSIATGGVLAGTYTAPNNVSGGFSSLSTTAGTVTAYCGTLTSPEGPGVFNVQVGTSGTLSGMAAFSAGTCGLTGRVTGTAISITSCEGNLATGTVSGGSISGTTFNSRGTANGTFTGSTSACQ
jgi:hypothetical protein